MQKKLQEAAISHTAAMETCFEHTPRVRPSELETDKLEIELVVEAVNYLHYVALRWNEELRAEFEFKQLPEAFSSTFCSWIY